MGDRHYWLVLHLNRSRKFDFPVVNGAWEGYYADNIITVDHTNMKYPGFSVGCTDQKRLAGDYNEVFLNYDDETYDGRTEYQKRCETDPRFVDMDVTSHFDEEMDMTLSQLEQAIQTLNCQILNLELKIQTLNDNVSKITNTIDSSIYSMIKKFLSMFAK